MDNSQSSECFPESADASFISPVPMDIVSYESLVAKTKNALTCDIARDIQKPTFTASFAALLNDCYNSIDQSLNLVSSIIKETEVSVDKLTEYLNDAVCLLQMFSDFIKTVIESVSMSCSAMESFPTTTGQIIIIVFIHCKDSESLYGHHLSSVEHQLKELFKSCHELQLTYLMILEKHFVFNLVDETERDVLVEALEINLKIGEIVQSLDVKTMAEQWKAFTMIVEKYSATLGDTNMFHDCTQVLCLLIRSNLKTAVEKNQDGKVIIRSLKVASFTIKILLKTCTIFKLATRRNHTNIIELMFFIWKTHHLDSTAVKSQITSLMNTNILTPTECLLKELLCDEIFVNSLVDRGLESMRQEDTCLAFVLTLTSAIKCLCTGNGKKTSAIWQLINCVYNILPYCHLWINLDIRLKTESDQIETHSVLEHLLVHIAALSFTLNNEEFNILEKTMIEAILGTECCSALFSTDLWVIMARHVSSQLLFNQVIWLCTMYKKLENHKMFQRSPQKIHLSYTIGRLFEVMNNDDKLKICKQYRIHDDDNISLWSALSVSNLPDEARFAAEDAVFEKLNNQFNCFNAGKDQHELFRLIKLISLAATCSFLKEGAIEDFLVKAWLQTCPKQFTLRDIDNSTVWFYDYLQSLVSFTESVWVRLCKRSTNMIKVFHVISSLIQQCGVDIKLLLTNLLCKLTSIDICNNPLVNNNFVQAFSCLLQDSEIVRNKLLTLLTKYRHDRNLDGILSNVQDDSFQESWCDIRSGKFCNDSKDELMKAIDYKYTHKCLESRIIELSGSSCFSMRKVDSSNFDFADDIDNLFDNDSESEPVCKKVKLNMSEAETLIERLEADVSSLFKVKENFTPDCKNRIQNVCDMLRNIIH